MSMTSPTRIDREFSFTYRWLRFGIISLALVIAFSPRASFSSDTEPATANFAKAVSDFKAGRMEDAKTAFLELEKNNPGDPTLLLNLGLIAQKEKRPGAALALWRKGLANHPTDEELLNAVDWLKPKLAKAEIARQFDTWEQIRKSLLLRVSPIFVIALSAVFLLIGGWLLLRWWGRRKRALEEDAALPPLPIAGFVISGLFLFLFTALLGLFLDRLDIRGTIVSTSVEARSAPETTATTLFTAFEGMEMIVRDTRVIETPAGKEAWRRVTYPGGLTGWVRDRDILTSIDSSDRAFLTGAAPKASEVQK